MSNDAPELKRFPARLAPARLRVCFSVFLAGFLLFASGQPSSARAASGSADAVQISTFSVDATPPLGHPLCGGWIKPLASVADPLLAKGVVIKAGGDCYVLCALDWCELRGGAYDQMRREIALGVGTSVDRVAVQTLHQHDAPIADSEAQMLLDKAPNAPAHLDNVFMAHLANAVGGAAQASLGRLRPVTHVGLSQAKVDRVASNRRVKTPEGTILVRYSSTTDPRLQQAPEGVIDPWLKTISFLDGEKMLAQLHYYATHPQSHYGEGEASADVPGIAREALEKKSGAFQIYFTGCAGNVTMGKYNDGKPERRAELASRVLAAMEASNSKIERFPISAADLEWRTTEARFVRRTEPEFSREAQSSILADPAAKSQPRLLAALWIAWLDRQDAGRAIELSSFRIGKARILHLPGEPFIEYQLAAQSLRPNDFIAVAGYSDCGMGYICTDAAYAEGGYEPTASLIGPGSEAVMRGAIAELLK